MARRVLLSVLGLTLAVGATAHLLDWDRPLLAALGLVAAPQDTRFAGAETVDWIDLIPVAETGAAARRNDDGGLPRGVIEHGQLGPATPPGPADALMPDLARLLGGTANPGGARRLSDAFGGFGNLKGLQPRTGSIRQDLDGKTVRIAGFIAPLAFNRGKISEFLLVPYVGACIHVPPPPANQIVFVGDIDGFSPAGGLLYPVWVTGVLRASLLDTELAAVGYQIRGGRIDPYE